MMITNPLQANNPPPTSSAIKSTQSLIARPFFAQVLLFIFVISFGHTVLANDLVDLSQIDASIVVDLKYATADNFMQEQLYQDDTCFLRPTVAKRLKRVQDNLRTLGYGLIAYDCYRPLSVQHKMFAKFPQPGFVADPETGSNHNRGAAVDVGLIDIKGNVLPMPSKYDEFSLRSYHVYTDAEPLELKHREILKEAMLSQGFSPISMEWWHYNAPHAQTYDLIDIPIEDM